MFSALIKSFDATILLLAYV